MAISPWRTDARVPRLLRTAILGAALALAPAIALAAKSYWLNAGENVVTCPGSTAGETLKAAVTNRFAPFTINGFVRCTEDGDAFRYDISFLNVAVNPTQRASLDRDEFVFDWLGLALYRPSARGEEQIEWLYDEARPVQGTLARRDTRKLIFGNISFRVPKAAAERATNMTFYLTSEGLLFNFRML